VTTLKTESTLYQVKDLKFNYRLGSQEVHALRGVSLSLQRGQFYCLCGPSGSGKTTLLNVLGLIEPVQNGQVLMDGKNLGQLSESEKNEIRRFHVGFIFQTFQLFPVLSAEENVEFFLARQGLGSKERKERTQEAIRAVGLWDHRQKKPMEMSGGQRQRVAIARALAKRPNVLIADEPTASLDQATGKEIMEILVKLNEERGMTLILSSHDPMVFHKPVPGIPAC